MCETTSNVDNKEFRILCDLKFNVFKSCAGCVARSRPEISAQFKKNRALLWVA